jgi:hypothetical protein
VIERTKIGFALDQNGSQRGADCRAIGDIEHGQRTRAVDDVTGGDVDAPPAKNLYDEEQSLDEWRARFELPHADVRYHTDVRMTNVLYVIRIPLDRTTDGLHHVLIADAMFVIRTSGDREGIGWPST